MTGRRSTDQHWLGATAALMAACTLLACGSNRPPAQSASTGGGATDTSAGTTAQTSHDSATAAATGAAPAPPTTADAGVVTAATLTVADLDTYQRGRQREIAVYKEARARLPQARSRMDTVSAIAALMPDSVQGVAAHDIGVPKQHYTGVTALVDELLSKRSDTSLAGRAAATIDTTGLPPAVRAQVRAGLAQTQQETKAADSAARAGLSPAVAAAFDQRRPALDSLRRAFAATLMQSPTQTR